MTEFQFRHVIFAFTLNPSNSNLKLALIYLDRLLNFLNMQTALAERLSEIMKSVPPAVGRLYFKVFVQTMRREWFGIDRHRMDKFMMLLRKFYAQHLRYLQTEGW